MHHSFFFSLHMSPFHLHYRHLQGIKGGERVSGQKTLKKIEKGIFKREKLQVIEKSQDIFPQHLLLIIALTPHCKGPLLLPHLPS